MSAYEGLGLRYGLSAHGEKQLLAAPRIMFNFHQEDIPVSAAFSARQFVVSRDSEYVSHRDLISVRERSSKTHPPVTSLPERLRNALWIQKVTMTNGHKIGMNLTDKEIGRLDLPAGIHRWERAIMGKVSSPGA